VLAFAVRAVVTTTPLAASVVAGFAASRLFRPYGWIATAVWVLWVAGASMAVLAVADLGFRRLLPLHRLLQLCLVFPDRAPSRLRLAVAAARSRRPESLAHSASASHEASEAAAHIVTLLGALAVHDRRTRGHSERVCAFTDLLAEQMQLPAWDRDRLMWVALVHDIGKLRITPRLLNKPERPTVSEWRALKEHPEHGAALIGPLREWLGSWADAVVQHHERYDGQGYPSRLRGEQICLGARIIAVTDAFEVMTAPRPYRRPVDAQSARAELARYAGSQFDPEVVRQFLAVGLPQLRKSMGWLSWLTQVPLLRSWPQLQAAPAATATQAVAATAMASSAGALMFGAASGPALAHADGPVAQSSAAVTHVLTSQRPTSTSAASTGSSTAGATVAPATKKPARDVTKSAAAAPAQPAATSPAATSHPSARSAAPAAKPTPAASCSSTDASSTHGKSGERHGRGHAYGRNRHKKNSDPC
jgi:hypothetical protein